MQQCDTLILADWCIPVEPADLVLSGHAVAISNGRIDEILPAAEARAKYRPGVLVERPGQVLIPGLVNTHTHAAMTLFRGLADDLALEPWLEDSIWPAERRWVSAEMVRDGTRLAISEMLLAGITCFSDQYFFPEIVAETALEMHMRAMIGTPVIDFATAWAGDAEECLSKGTELVHDRYADHALITASFTPHSVATVSDESFTALRILADQLDAPIQIHLHESSEEISRSVEQSGKRPVERLTGLGIVNSSLLAVHAVHLSDAETALFAEAGVSVAHCPRSNLKLADGIAPITEMQHAGINVALGTDGAASNNSLDILAEARTAALLGKVSAADATAVPAGGALRMATLNGATALGLDDCIGSIENGKWADLCCVDLRKLHCQPLYNAASQLVYAARSSDVTDVWVAGRQLVEHGRLGNLDTDELLQRTAEWQRRISAERVKSPA